LEAFLRQRGIVEADLRHIDPKLQRCEPVIFGKPNPHIENQRRGRDIEIGKVIQYLHYSLLIKPDLIFYVIIWEMNIQILFQPYRLDMQFLLEKPPHQVVLLFYE
jgi:hypothetical protein